MLVGYLINRKYIKEAVKKVKINSHSKIIGFAELFERCWASYTHTIFSDLSNNTYFIKIFSLFYSSISTISTENDKIGSLSKRRIILENLKKFKVMSEDTEKYLWKIESIRDKIKIV